MKKLSLRTINGHNIIPIPKGEHETAEQFNLRKLFQPSCSKPVPPRGMLEYNGDFINRVLLSRNDSVKK